MLHVCYNGNFIRSNEPILFADNRSFKYGDGVFETMKVYNGNILLNEYHADRLFSSLKLLEIEHALTNFKFLNNIILELCAKNKCSELARVRLSFFRKNENDSEFVIEAKPLLNITDQLNEKGFELDYFPFSRKSIDAYSNLKTSNYLPYVMAARFAEKNNLDDCIILNDLNKVCETSKANIFLIKDDTLLTPGLDQGCVSGIMRNYLIDQCRKYGYEIKQKAISKADMLEADEVFLTNAIYNIRWVEKLGERKYDNFKTAKLFKQFVSTFYW